MTPSFERVEAYHPTHRVYEFKVAECSLCYPYVPPTPTQRAYLELEWP